MIISMALGLACFSEDRRNPSEYALKSWVRYPSFIKSIFIHRDQCNSLECIPVHSTVKDINLVRSRVQPGEQVAMFDLYDWSYLTGAQRAPLMLFLPSVDIFTKPQLEETIRRLKTATYVFTSKSKDGEPEFGNSDIREALMPTFHQQYVKEAEGDRLIVWRQRNSKVES